MRVLRNFNITKISDLELISNSTDRLDITFHFFGIKGDSNRIREAITRMVERGRIGNITLVSNYHLFDENPPLNLLEMAINQKSAIREDSEFIISCTAQGSSRMQFQWYKDGAIVNTSKATREIWTTVLPPDTKDTFTAILGVTKANRMDEGIYTCKVTDWGVEQCRSLHVHVRSPPRLRVDPASVTLQRGDSLRVRCLSPGNDDIKRYAQLGYSWTRNGVLFQSNPATVMWEDLYPDGSILKINNIQKSAEYACIVSNSVRPVSKSVYITVIDRNAVRVCHAESLYGVRWPTSAPGAAIVADCPRGFQGHSRRICESHDAANSTWLLPDFSLCIRDQLMEIYNKFRALSAGFQQSNSSAILKACFDYTIRRHKHFLPGEAGFLIDMLHELDSYLQVKGTQLEREMAAEVILHILDKVMQNAQSLNSQQQIKKLQLLTQSAALNRETIAASQLATSTSTASAAAAAAAAAASSSSSSSSSSTSAAAAAAAAIATQTDTTAAAAATSGAGTALSPTLIHTATATGVGTATGGRGTPLRTDSSASILTVDEDSLSLDRLNSLRIYMTSVKMLPFNLRIYGDDLFSDQLYMDIGLSTRLLNIMANSTIFASVISYKNLKSFLPKTYYTRGSDPKDSDYVLASRIIQTWLFQSNRSNDNFREPLDLSFEAGHVEIIFQHEAAPKTGDWVAVCGHDYKASFESTWRSDLCITKNLMENITRCICPLSGTYVVMLTKRNYNSHPAAPAQHPIFVIISCACCLLQSCSAFLILLPIWYNRKCAITFLKMQFCISTSSIMVIFLLGFLKMLPVNWQAIISSSLASLLLLGVSTLIAIALVVHSELVPKKLLLHIGKMSVATKFAATHAAKKEQQQQDMAKRRHSTTSGNIGTAGGSTAASISVTNITQISNGNDTDSGSVQSATPAATAPTQSSAAPATAPATAALTSSDLYLPASVRAAIGISWLLPLLFAITSPLICSIIGKWPRHWWLEVMNGSAPTTTTISATLARTPTLLSAAAVGGSDYWTAQRNFNGDNAFDTNSNNNNNMAPVPTTTGSTTQHSAATTTTAAGADTTTSSAKATASFATNWTQARNIFSTDIYNDDFGSSSSTDAGRFNAANGNSDGNGNGNGTAPSLSFVIFVCVDVLFILLCCALLVILIKKLLWLWHKNRNVRTHPLDKFNMALQRRIGLIYRAGCLLLIKLSNDALFVAYVNTAHDSLWCYPFGISCILLGFAILFCFVIRAECSLRATPGGSNNSGTLKKKLSSSKTSLDDNYCTGSINSPLSFYASHEKEKENECGAPPPAPALTTLLPPQQIEISSGVQLPLTIISSAPRCQLLPATAGAGSGAAGSVKSFLSAATLDRKLPHVTCLQESASVGATTGIASPATRCCNILGGGGSGGSATASMAGDSGAGAATGVTSGNIAYYDAYSGATVGGMTGSLQRRSGAGQDFVGVETLDILQGVAADSIIGIRASGMLPLGAHYHQQQHAPLYHPQHAQQHVAQHHTSYLDATMLPTAIVSISGLTPVISYAQNSYSSSGNSNATVTTVSTTTATTQTPKAQKRVTIMEPTTHTSFDPLLPTMVAVSSAATSHHLLLGSPTPIITITSSAAGESNATTVVAAAADSQLAAAATPNANDTAAAAASCNSSPDDENSMSGMLDRITHDLDYLLNRTNEVPPQLPTTATSVGEIVAITTTATTTAAVVASKSDNGSSEQL